MLQSGQSTKNRATLQLAVDRVERRMAGRTKKQGFLWVLLASLSWSTSGVFITWILRAGGPSGVVLAFWRDLGACVCLIAGLALLRPSWLKIHWVDLPWLAAAGGIGIGAFHAVWNLSVAVNGVAVAGAINHTSAAFAALGARVIWREPMTVHKKVALVLALVGSLVVYGIDRLLQARVDMTGLLLALGSAVCLSAYGVFGNAVTQRIRPLTMATYGFAFAVMILLPLQFWQAIPQGPNPTLAKLYAALVLVSTVIGFSAYARGLRETTVTVASILSTVSVVFHQVWAYFFLGERLQLLQVAGVLLVIASMITLLMAPLDRVPGTTSDPGTNSDA